MPANGHHSMLALVSKPAGVSNRNQSTGMWCPKCDSPMLIAGCATGVTPADMMAERRKATCATCERIVTQEGEIVELESSCASTKLFECQPIFDAQFSHMLIATCCFMLATITSQTHWMTHCAKLMWCLVTYLGWMLLAWHFYYKLQIQ